MGELARNCLFLRIETVIPKAGTPPRLLYEGQTTFAEGRVAIEADVTFVNMKRFRELLPGLATSSPG